MKGYRETAVGVFVLVGLVCVGYLTVKLGRMELLSDEGYRVVARFSSVTGLRVGADVEIAGVPVGKVSAIELAGDSSSALVVLRLRPDLRLAEDTIAAIKTSGLIGDKYINLSPGGSTALLKAGDEIVDTNDAVDIEGLISKYVFGSVK